MKYLLLFLSVNGLSSCSTLKNVPDSELSRAIINSFNQIQSISKCIWIPGELKKIQHRALAFGGFGGLGTTFISPWTTDYRTTDEYNALTLSRGMSLMAGINNLTVGAGVGCDYATDRDKNIWIYQNKPWFGLAISLNIN